MSGCFDNIHCELELGEKRNAVASVTAGVLFFVGWWVIIDVMAVYSSDFNVAYYACGAVGTLAMFVVNAVSNSQVRGDAMTDGLLGTRGARLWLLFGFVFQFGALIASIWILFAAYVVPQANNTLPGIALFIQNFLIFFASVIYKFGRTEDLWS